MSDQWWWKRANDVIHEAKMLAAIMCRKQQLAGIKLTKYTARAPHVTRHAPACTKYYLWRSVLTRVNDRTPLVVVIASAAKVNELYACRLWHPSVVVQSLVVVHQKNVLHLQISVYDSKTMQELECLKQLDSNVLNDNHRKRLVVVQLQEIVQGGTQTLKDDAIMSPKSERVKQSHAMSEAPSAASVNVLNHPCLDQCRFVVALHGSYNFDRDIVPASQIQAVEYSSKGAHSNLLDHLVLFSNHRAWVALVMVRRIVMTRVRSRRSHATLLSQGVMCNCLRVIIVIHTNDSTPIREIL